MTGSRHIPDGDARRAAETTFDRNVVVVAGAGTGKTTLLVNRLVHLLMKEPEPVSITETVALTYTNKAATEMKVRLRERLTALLPTASAANQRSDGGAVSIDDLRERYFLTGDEIAARASAALRDLEKAQIGTVHSFAAHLLRLFPLEAGVDPGFREDEGLRFDESFRMAWDVWIDRELGRGGAQHSRWRALLQSTTLDQLRELAYALCSDLVDLDELRGHIRSEPNQTLMAWIDDLHERAQRLLASHDRAKRRKIEQMLAAAVSVMALFREQGPEAVTELDAAVPEWLAKDPGQAISDWDAHEFVEATGIIKIARQMLSFDRHYFLNLLTVIGPLVSSIKGSFAHTGWIAFDGLLAGARRLLSEHPLVRERVKREYRAILIDEFQDTDPVQYEILLALAERSGHCSRTWQEMALEPGKLFIVGDPKQSIYAFRRADMEAFDRVVAKVLDDGGAMHTLTTNFRSDASILGAVNDVFDRVFVRQPLVQPANVRLETNARPARPGLDSGVVIQMTAPQAGDDAFDAAGAARAEGEVLARWLHEDVLRRPGVSAGQVAFLFRQLTQADAYLDALRRYDIPYLIEGEKHFYRRQEVIDLINVLRVLDHPHDHIAMLGVLRSSLGGLSDRDIYDLDRVGGFDYLSEAIAKWSHPRAEAVRRLYGHLASLRAMVAVVPLDEGIQLVFDRLPVLELAAASLHGEQAVANLLKVKDTAAALTDRPHLTLSGLIELMVSRLDERPDEAETPLAEDTSDAVQILTIHKAKGLEFPIVVLPGLHQGSGRDRGTSAVLYDWSTGIYGLSVGSQQSLGYLRVQEKQLERERAERRRVLYVGMTRAKDLLVLSAALMPRSVGETALDWIKDIAEGTVGNPLTERVKIGSSEVAHRLVHVPDRKWPRRFRTAQPGGPTVDAQSLARTWEQRTARWEAVRTARWHVTASSLQDDHRGEPSTTGQAGGAEVSRLVGILAHRLLEDWDFGMPHGDLVARVDARVHRFLPRVTDGVRSQVAASLKDIFVTFCASEAYARLRSADILGREVPFMMPWGEGEVMEGVIDVLYRLDGQTCIADYKTDRTSRAEAPVKAGLYARQAAIYREAALKCLGLSAVSFEFVFLRAGVSVEV